MDTDTIITRITEAATARDAMAILATVPRRALDGVADQLYVEWDGASTAAVRQACVREARA
jgi:hypothetical protein